MKCVQCGNPVSGFGNLCDACAENAGQDSVFVPHSDEGNRSPALTIAAQLRQANALLLEVWLRYSRPILDKETGGVRRRWADGDRALEGAEEYLRERGLLDADGNPVAEGK